MPQAPINLDSLVVTEAAAPSKYEDFDGIAFAETTSPHGTTLWVYRPPGQHEPQSLPVVLIGPAGSTLIVGMDLAPGDRAEHLPYVREGFVVVAYSVDGGSGADEDVQRFADAMGGILNALEAEAFLSHIPEADPERVFVVGHSSAGDLALLVGSHLNVAGIVAFNTSGEGCWFQPAAFLQTMAMAMPGLADFCQQTRAASHVGHVKAPVFLFGSTDDTVVRLEEVQRLAQSLTEAGVDVRLETGSGGHYASMMSQGIPMATAWMKAIASANEAD